MSRNKKRLKIIYFCLVVMLCTLFILVFYFENIKSEKTNFVNKLRLESNELYQEISDLWPLDDEDILLLDEKIQTENIHITIIKLDETIIYTNSLSITERYTQILLEYMYMDSSYISNNQNMYKLTQPIYSEKKVEGFVIFEKFYLYDKSEIILILNILKAGIVLCLLTIMVLFGFLIFQNKTDKLKNIQNGLVDLSKGIYSTIAVEENAEFKELYSAYNILVEELKYISSQQELSLKQQKEFLTVISHEIKTPISIINAYVEGLLKGVAKTKEAKEKYLETINGKMNQLTKQVEDLFKYSQVQVNRFKYNFEECYADEVVKKIFDSLSGGRHKKTIINNLLPKCIVNVDVTRFEQVIMNLYNNAVKHTSEDGDITLSAYREEDEIVIEVSDKGEGISLKDLPYIFDYYYQGKTSTKKDYGGAGLGLAICKEIIDRHNGTIKVKSSTNVGTTIFIKIPIV